MDYSENGVPMFNGQNGFKYEMWSIRMKVFLQAQGHYIWLSIVTGYDSSKRVKTATKKELRKNNKISMDFIWEGLPNPVREKVGKCSSTKELWDKLHDIYSSPITDSGKCQRRCRYKSRRIMFTMLSKIQKMKST
jgi:hypothetical protein